MLFCLVCACLARLLSAQSYAERIVPHADTFPSSDSYDYNDDYTDGYGFDEEDTDVYKWNVEEYPHPRNKSRFCNRFKPSHVCDPDRILEKEHADFLDNFIAKMYKETPCICEVCGRDDGGIVVGIALLKHLFQPYNAHPVKVIRAFAEKLRSAWNLGKCDNDILIVIATADRLWYTDVGKATSSYLSVHEAHRIFLVNKAKFSAGNFFEGLTDILQSYYDVTRVMQIARSQDKQEVDMAAITGAIIGSIVLFGVLLFLAFVVYRKCRKNKNGDENGKFSFKSWPKKSRKQKAKYQPCETDGKEPARALADEEQIDFTLAMPDDTSFPNSEELEKDLVSAAEGIVKTFPTHMKQKVLMTDM